MNALAPGGDECIVDGARTSVTEVTERARAQAQDTFKPLRRNLWKHWCVTHPITGKKVRCDTISLQTSIEGMAQTRSAGRRAVAADAGKTSTRRSSPSRRARRVAPKLPRGGVGGRLSDEAIVELKLDRMRSKPIDSWDADFVQSLLNTVVGVPRLVHVESGTSHTRLFCTFAHPDCDADRVELDLPISYVRYVPDYESAVLEALEK